MGQGTVVQEKKATPIHTKSEERVFVPGRSIEGVPTNNSLRLVSPLSQPQLSDTSSNQSEKQDILIGVRGKWYNVTNFVPHHPGGDVILEFAGQDATAQFMAYHSPSVLRHRRPIGTYPFDEDKPGGEPMQGDWMKVCDKYEKLGYFKTPISFVLERFVILIGFLTVSLSCVRLYVMTSNEWKGIALITGAVCLAGFWQQSGFLMHDCMHNLLFHKRRLDQNVGWLCGNVFLGLSSKCWRDEHNEHHLFTNTAIDGVGPSDPQMIEDIWVQDVMITQYFHDIPPFARQMIGRYQHLYFMPLCMIAGPYAIKAHSLASAGRKRPMEYIGIALHFIWVGELLSFFPTWKESFIFYGIAMMCLGVLSVQLLVSHYSKPWAEKESVKETGSWAQRQVESVVDISCPTWLDWFHGGLHLHSPHHLFPRLPRCHYREAQQDVLDMCKKNNVTLDVMPWFAAIANTIRHLRNVGDQWEAKKWD